MNVEIMRFKVCAGKRKQVDEWLAFLNENMSEVLLTLEKEKMYVETIFREVLEGQEFLYWYSVQGDGGQEVEESTHWIDKKHLDYWKACIDPTFSPVKLTTEVVMIPDNIRQQMQ